MSDEFEMVMPFVTVASKGGPHDDASYVAGYEMGSLDALLNTGPSDHMATIHTESVAQADLIAMRYGYRCVSEVSEEHPEWTFVRFERQNR